MIQLDSVSKSYGGDPLFEGLNWKLPDNNIIGLVGANGVGKSTLFRIICGEEIPDDGRVVIPRHVRVGHLPQEVTESHEGSVVDVIVDGARELLALEERMNALQAKLVDATGEEAEQLSVLYGEVQDQFERGGGYSIRAKARQIAGGLGFSAEAAERSLSEFSGGWRMRALVGRLLLEAPEVMLLDEPTNHLDLESMEWLENYLKNYSGTVVIISHDRYFLNRLTDQIAELANSTVRTFTGTYDDYLLQRDELRERLQAERDEQEREIARIEDFVERFRYKATKSAQVQSRIKMLEKIELVQVPPDTNATIHFDFPQPPRVGKKVAALEGVKKAYEDNVVFEGLDFQVFRHDKIALVGPNGAGKSTMLKLLAGEIAADEGRVEYGSKVEFNYFAQHSVDQLDLNRTVFAEMEASASPDAFPRIRSVLGAFKFGDNDVDKVISVLSGGEKSRLALAKMLLEPAGLLLLDEPTNHLDIASRQMLERALIRFQGSFCVVSHDRYFLNEVVTKVVHIEDGTLTEYDGDYDYYRWKHSQDFGDSTADDTKSASAPAPSAAGAQLSHKEIRQRSAELRRERDTETRALRKKLKEVERKIEETEARHAELEQELADPAIYDDAERLTRTNIAYQQAADETEALMEMWEELGSELDAIDTRYAALEAELNQ
ncbi:ribosomal protection-like ABC-F family protein [Bradymonas sediminis]|uniref:ABC transporter ATP-binding protein n=1 Tax=Bradymonas sediminis TaxID=1548548 RepID=A0A2Z4FK12_9DELT|nr:ABC-F family ATP-binding cassette domain-containing protein [Bradymonas sediminis]AWV89292.1 ABC transporter ATP-binding protein [Bradymonas sediminis]TDP73465.1 ATP-binding cassette subfamily F protein 3 [Bradymonas sediminis]